MGEKLSLGNLSTSLKAIIVASHLITGGGGAATAYALIEYRVSALEHEQKNQKVVNDKINRIDRNVVDMVIAVCKIQAKLNNEQTAICDQLRFNSN